MRLPCVLFFNIYTCPKGGEINSEILGWYGGLRRTNPKFPDFFLSQREGAG
jgi:hypothetical protein